MVSSHQTRDLECFADSSSVPWNPPTIFHPDLIGNSTADVSSLAPRAALSAIPFVSDLCGVDVDPRLSNHQTVPLWARHAFCKRPLLFSSSSRCHNFCLSGSACGHYAYPDPAPLLLAEKSWESIDVVLWPFRHILQQFTS